MRRQRSAHRLIAVLALGLAGSAACGDDGTPATSPPGTSAPATSAPSSTAPVTTSATTAPATTAPATTQAATTTTRVPALEQPVVWPAPGAGFESPEAAAADFVVEVLGVPPVLGEFQAGDSLSGEIEVLSPGEGPGATPVARGLLLLRRLGPDLGWYVLAAANENAAIGSPEAAAVVAAGPLTVEGVARGYEGTVFVSAFPAGDASAVLDEVLTHGGALAEPEPFSVTLDLSGASPGDVITLLVRGDRGLETDPGEFGAIPIVIAA